MAKKSYLSEKEAVFVSSVTTERYRKPTNERVAGNMMQFVFDHKHQVAHIPDNNSKVLIEAVQRGPRKGGYQSTNINGRTAALGPLAHADLGGTPDEPGRFQRKG